MDYNPKPGVDDSHLAPHSDGGMLAPIYDEGDQAYNGMVADAPRFASDSSWEFVRRRIYRDEDPKFLGFEFEEASTVIAGIRVIRGRVDVKQDMEPWLVYKRYEGWYVSLTYWRRKLTDGSYVYRLDWRIGDSVQFSEYVGFCLLPAGSVKEGQVYTQNDLDDIGVGEDMPEKEDDIPQETKRILEGSTSGDEVNEAEANALRGLRKRLQGLDSTKDQQTVRQGGAKYSYKYTKVTKVKTKVK